MLSIYMKKLHFFSVDFQFGVFFFRAPPISPLTTILARWLLHSLHHYIHLFPIGQMVSLPNNSFRTEWRTLQLQPLNHFDSWCRLVLRNATASGIIDFKVPKGTVILCFSSRCARVITNWARAVNMKLITDSFFGVFWMPSLCITCAT